MPFKKQLFLALCFLALFASADFISADSAGSSGSANIIEEKLENISEKPETASNSAKNSRSFNQGAQSLNDFFEKSSALDIHNRSLELLQKNSPDQEEEQMKALLLIKRNFYQNLFLPSYFTLANYQESVFLLPALLLLALFILSAGFIGLIFKKQRLSLKSYGLFLGIFALLLISSQFLNKRLAFLEDIPAYSLPFESITANETIKAGEELILLEEKAKWLNVKKENQQKVWIQKKESYFELF